MCSLPPSSIVLLDSQHLKARKENKTMSKSTIRRMGVMVVMVLGMLALASPAAWATDFVDNSTADDADANTLDNVCDSNASWSGEQCTLRAAIEQANSTPNG